MKVKRGFIVQKKDEITKKQFTLSVVAYNNSNEVIETFLSIEEVLLTENISYHFYIIDNDSTPEEVEILKSFFVNKNKADLILSDKNLGYGNAHNLTLDKIDSEFHIVCNPDISLKGETIFNNVYSYLKEHEDVVLISPKVCFPDGSIQLLPKRNPTFLGVVSRRIFEKSLRKYREAFEMADFDENEIFEIEFATGCFMIHSTEVLKKVGGFDDRYFMYFEDADLTRMMAQYGKVIYYPKVRVFHEWKRDGSKNTKLFMIQIISMFKYFRKWGYQFK